MARPRDSVEQVREVRESLLDVAQRLLEEGGPASMSFRTIAAEAGCSHTRAYHYFDGKPAIIDALRIRAYQWVLDVISTAASSRDTPIEGLHALSEAYVRAGLARPRMYDLLYTTEGRIDADV